MPLATLEFLVNVQNYIRLKIPFFPIHHQVTLFNSCIEISFQLKNLWKASKLRNRLQYSKTYEMLYGSPRVVQWHKLFVRHCFDVALAIIVRSISTHEQATENLVPLKLAHRHTRHQFFYLFIYFCNGLLIFYQISFFF